MNELGRILADTWTVWFRAISLRPDPAAFAADGFAPFVLIALVATVAAGIGRLGVLVLNRMRGPELLYAGVWSLLTMLVAAIVTGGAIVLSAWLVLGTPGPGVVIATRLVLAASGPMVFSFLTILPLVGPPLERLLQLWALLALWVACRAVFGGELWRLALAMALAAGITIILQARVEPRLARWRDLVYRRLTGRPLYQSTRQLLRLIES